MTPVTAACGRALERLYPGYFALVMATGIVSTAAQLFNLQVFSTLLLVVATAGYAVLVALHIGRMLMYGAAMRDDAKAPGRAFGFFTFVAASDVLSVRYASAGVMGVAAALALVGVASWLLLTYTIPVGLMLGSENRRLGPSVNASWLIWVVATQSVSTAASMLASTGPDRALLSFVAAVFWGIGSMLYLVLITIVTARMLLAAMPVTEMAPPYWINMGATAITVLAGVRLLGAPLPGQLQSILPFVTGISFMFWAFGSFWIPTVVLFGFWRYGRGGHPVVYEPALWSMVFPLGMYTTATDLLGKVARLTWLLPLAWGASWGAYAAWVIVFAAMARSLTVRRSDIPNG